MRGEKETNRSAAPEGFMSRLEALAILEQAERNEEAEAEQLAEVGLRAADMGASAYGAMADWREEQEDRLASDPEQLGGSSGDSDSGHHRRVRRHAGPRDLGREQATQSGTLSLLPLAAEKVEWERKLEQAEAVVGGPVELQIIWPSR